MARRELLGVTLPPRTTVVRVEMQEVMFDRGVAAPVHEHPCAVVGIVLEGTLSYAAIGKESRSLAAGDAFHEPARTRITRFENIGDGPARFVAIYLVESETSERTILLDV